MTKHIYSHLLDPTIYPDFSRRPNRVPTWETFGHATQFTALRAFTIKDNKLVDFREDLDMYEKLNLGRVIWPVFQTVFAENFYELVGEIRRRGLYLFDIWGHVPGSGFEGMWSHVTPPRGMVERLQQTLGERFLGFDNGEQDGRYVGGYAGQQCPSFNDRFRQYLNFQRHFERMCDDLGNKMTTLVSLCFGHYFLKEGNHILIGAETAQALPNSQVYYAFIRGAGKQYGVHWFGNASVFNRWGYKSYESEGNRWGPTRGTSLSLLRRLLYTHYLYNSVAIGFEQSWLRNDNVEKRISGQPMPAGSERKPVLSPLGEIQASANAFVSEHGQPGVMQTPVALLLDHFAGWAMPRHLYSGRVYQVWGAMPYDAGDFLTHGVLSLLYPGYDDSSYFRDERGFLAPTPYGDMADVLLSDVPQFVLAQYNLVIAAGALTSSLELRDKLRDFVKRGGHLVVTAANARHLFQEWNIGPACEQPAGAAIAWADGTKTAEQGSISLCPATLPKGAEVVARCKGKVAVAGIRMGKGRVTLLLSPYGINEKPSITGPLPNEEEKPLACPYPLLKHVRRALSEALAKQRMFSVGQGLSFIVCRKAACEYTIGIHNNDLGALPFKIVSHCGKIEKIVELETDQRAKTSVGYWPEGKENPKAGISGDDTVAAGDIRLFSVSIKETNVRERARTAPPAAVKNRFLALRGITDLKEAILGRPTFFQRFDGVSLDWTYIRDRDKARIERERGWLERQKLKIVVDFSRGLNFYPDLTLLDTLMFRYEESKSAIDGCFDKMAALNAGMAVFSLHRKPENHCDAQRADDRFLAGVRDLCRRAAEKGITIFLQPHPAKWHPCAKDTIAFIKQANAGNLRFALNAGHSAMIGETLDAGLADAGDLLGLILLSGSGKDSFGQQYDAHLPLYKSGIDLSALEAVTGKVPVVYDADYSSWDETYRDIVFSRH